MIPRLDMSEIIYLKRDFMTVMLSFQLTFVILMLSRISYVKNDDGPVLYNKITINDLNKKKNSIPTHEKK